MAPRNRRKKPRPRSGKCSANGWPGLDWKRIPKAGILDSEEGERGGRPARSWLGYLVQRHSERLGRACAKPAAEQFVARGGRHGAPAAEDQSGEAAAQRLAGGEQLGRFERMVLDHKKSTRK